MACMHAMWQSVNDGRWICRLRMFRVDAYACVHALCLINLNKLKYACMTCMHAMWQSVNDGRKEPTGVPDRGMGVYQA